MFVVDRVCRESELPAASKAYARDTLTLGWEDRVQAHGHRRTDGGVEFGLALPRGTILRSGDCLLLDDVRYVVVVVERLEPVFVIEPRTATEWGTYAYQIGNRHQPIMITREALVCPDVPGVELLLQQHQIPYTRGTKGFTPLVATVGHQH